MSAAPHASVDRTMWTSLLHAGLAGSFMRFPHVAPNTEALRESGARAAVYGIPFDATNISRTGANYGPRGIRDVSCQFLTYNAMYDFDVADALAPVDCGDCDVIPGDPGRTFARAQEDIEAILRAGALPVTLGGEHSVTIPAVRAVRAVHENPGLILVDTHLDTAPDVGGELLSHCCPITRAVDAGFDPARIALLGISGWMNPRTELAYCRIAWAVERTNAVVRDGTDGAYLSFDVDSLDAAHAPGTCCPTPGGLTSREALELVRGVCAGGLLGVDVVEVAPSLDSTPATALIGGRVALEAMAFHAGCGR
jgi:agmatinase